jgi:ABC-type uncharacterized transport system substrate-binding protein
MNAKKLIYFISVLVCSLVLQNCATEGKNHKKIVYINSYHHGHPSSDEIMEGFIKNMPADSFEVYSWYMDTKRNPSKEYIQDKAVQLLDSIQKISPDLLVVSDDNAVKYIVEPNIDKLSMPIVFCGVNWTDKEYNLPTSQVTGIIEILPVADAIQKIKSYYPSIKNLLVVNENTTTSRKEEQILDTLFQSIELSADFALVDNFEQWKTAFSRGNVNYDVIYISTHGAVKGWNHDEAVAYINNNIKVPVFTCEDFMMPYAVLGVTKIAEEHGIWAASTAKKILSGIGTEEIPVTRNKESKSWLNSRLAQKIGFKPDDAFLRNAIEVMED